MSPDIPSPPDSRPAGSPPSGSPPEHGEPGLPDGSTKGAPEPTSYVALAVVFFVLGMSLALNETTRWAGVPLLVVGILYLVMSSSTFLAGAAQSKSSQPDDPPSDGGSGGDRP